MLRKWLKAGFMEKHVLSPTETGVPQGGIASPVMENLALDRLEKLLKALYPPNTKRAQHAKVHVVRSCDDFLMTGSSYHLLDQEVKHVVSKATFIKVDTAIFKSLWSWATRRHPKKSGRRVTKKYFRTRNGRQWTFVETYARQQG